MTVRIAIVLTIALGAHADGLASPSAARRSEVAVSELGASVRTELAATTSTPSPWSPDGGPAELRWSWSNPPESSWVGSAVAVGDRGGLVWAGLTVNDARTALLSSYDADPPVPIWQDLDPEGADEVRVAAARRAAVMVAAITRPGSVTVRRYPVSGSEPSWVFEFPPGFEQGRVAVSDDGTRIAAAAIDAAGDLAVRVLDGDGAVVSAVDRAADSLRALLISGDGRVVYVAIPPTLVLYGADDGAQLGVTTLDGSFDSHAISTDGSHFAFGGFNLVKLFRDVGGVYIPWIVLTPPGDVYAARVALDGTGARLAYALFDFGVGHTYTVTVYDVEARTVLWERQQAGGGTLQALPSGLWLSDDGERLGLCTWGDADRTHPQLQLLDASDGAIEFAVETRGSVLDCALSPEGRTLAAAGKAIHANEFGSGGDVLLATGESAVRVSGVPRSGAGVRVSVAGEPGDVGSVMLASLAPPTEPGGPTAACGGTLLLDPDAVAVLDRRPLADGVADYPVSIPADPAAVGRSIHLQAALYDGVDCRLTPELTPLTVLPPTQP